MAAKNKLPWDASAWLTDPRLSLCSPATRGIWMDLLCVMWESGGQGVVEFAVPDLCRLARCTRVELAPALDELHRTKAADISWSDDRSLVRICNRRMHNAWQRCQPKPAKETVGAPFSYPADFERFWAAYPARRGVKQGKVDAFKAWQKLAPDGSLLAIMLVALERQKAWPDWLKESGRYIPMASTWLNARRWEDEDSPTSGGRHTAEQRQARVLADRQRRQQEQTTATPTPQQLEQVRQMASGLAQMPPGDPLNP